MKLVDKIKNMFTEEVEEERPVIKKEVMHVDIELPKEEVKETIDEKVEPVREERPAPIFFDDEDFESLEKPKIEKQEEPLHEEKTSLKDKLEEKYKGNATLEEPKKIFKPSPIISPVYGVLDKNYSKEDLDVQKVIPTTVYYDKEVSIDDIRNKAYGTLEDDIEVTLFGKEEAPLHEKKEDFDNLLEEDLLDDDSMKFEESETFEKEENEENEQETYESLKIEDDFDLSDDIMNSYHDAEQDKDDNISDTDLFDLIDSMYEKSDDE